MKKNKTKKLLDYFKEKDLKVKLRKNLIFSKKNYRIEESNEDYSNVIGDFKTFKEALQKFENYNNNKIKKSTYLIINLIQQNLKIKEREFSFSNLIKKLNSNNFKTINSKFIKIKKINRGKDLCVIKRNELIKNLSIVLELNLDSECIFGKENSNTFYFQKCNFSKDYKEKDKALEIKITTRDCIEENENFILINLIFTIIEKGNYDKIREENLNYYKKNDLEKIIKIIDEVIYL